MNKTTTVIYKHKRNEITWQAVKLPEYYLVGCSGGSISWSQKYPLHFDPADILHNERIMVSNHIKCMLLVNNACEEFLDELLSYINEESYNLKFKPHV